MITSGIRLIARALESAAASIDRPAEAQEHGPWCERSLAWAPESDAGYIVPVRIGATYVGKMISDDGWKQPIKTVFLRPAGDGTNHMVFEAADEIDFVSNKTIQRAMFAALDLAAALDETDQALPDDVIVALADFKRAASARTGVSE